MNADGAHQRTSELLRAVADEVHRDSLSFGELVDRFERRGFGLLLVLATLPAFIPSPVGAGLLAGPLVVACGLQLVLGMEHPWLPRWLRERHFARRRLERFLERLGGVLERIERLCRPRLDAVLGPAGIRVTGALVMLHGVALALPVPFTNYPFALVLLIVAIALVEGDGALALAGWLGMLVSIGIVTALAGTLGALVT